MPRFVPGGKLLTTLNFPTAGTIHNSEPQDPKTWYFALNVELHLFTITASDHLPDIPDLQNNPRRYV